MGDDDTRFIELSSEMRATIYIHDTSLRRWQKRQLTNKAVKSMIDHRFSLKIYTT